MRKRRNTVVVLDQVLVKSRAWLSLTGISTQVYLLFRTKCQMERKSGCRKFEVTNNGKLVFTYAEAKASFGITAPRFRRAIDDLIAKGFIDVESTGMGVFKATTFYSISDRWTLYDGNYFTVSERPKPIIANPGFKKGNHLSPKKKSSDENVHGPVYENVVVNGVAVNENVVPKFTDKAL